MRTFEDQPPLFHRPSWGAWDKFNITSPWFVIKCLRPYSFYCHSVRVSAMYLGVLLSKVITTVYNIKHNKERRYLETEIEKFLRSLLEIKKSM